MKQRVWFVVQWTLWKKITPPETVTGVSDGE